jgi:hypothetical protein
VNVKKIDNNKAEKKSHLMASNIILFDIGNIKFLHLLSPQMSGSSFNSNHHWHHFIAIAR